MKAGDADYAREVSRARHERGDLALRSCSLSEGSALPTSLFV